MKSKSLKDNKFLKDVLTLLNVIIIGYAAILAATSILAVISGTGLFDRMGMKVDVQIQPAADFSDWRGILALAANLLTAGLIVYLIYLARNFIKNLIEGRIFDPSNTRLADRAWKVFLALTFLSIRMTATGHLLQPPFSLDASMSAVPLLGALIIWILMKILEKGIEIAQENEFTI
ncbi:YjbE family integral membrane protein [Streptococcus sp. DD11]|uniref:DUF2975 domain-containing protein n=1 Tax=Streptococcus sp. DD11 TaxID=1777879 RepID=UPI00079BA74E|nr:DUF2975 domain-containing protein [Streptococcus sp. DD11]KXT84529.1 YjbE family integral membrane protein [Streptococcus sp. DD11]